MTEPKLLTEAEWREWLEPTSMEAKIVDLRERGLIAPEPVDPLLEEAEALHQDWVAGKHGEHGDTIDLALAALRRGMELARPALTREQVQRMVIDALENACVDRADFEGGTTRRHREDAHGFVTRLHAALTGGEA